MQIVEFKDSELDEDCLKTFFRNNDYLFPDPFSLHVDINLYVKKLLLYGTVIVAKNLNEIIGIACFYANDYSTYFAHLQVLLVCSKYQGMEVGCKLIKAVHNMAFKEGMKYCTLTVDISNINAEKLYTRLGYKNYNVTNTNRNKKNMIVVLGREKLI